MSIKLPSNNFRFITGYPTCYKDTGNSVTASESSISLGISTGFNKHPITFGFYIGSTPAFEDCPHDLIRINFSGLSLDSDTINITEPNGTPYNLDIASNNNSPTSWTFPIGTRLEFSRPATYLASNNTAMGCYYTNTKGNHDVPAKLYWFNIQHNGTQHVPDEDSFLPKAIVKHLVTPTDSEDAATKAYVDSEIKKSYSAGETKQIAAINSAIAIGRIHFTNNNIALTIPDYNGTNAVSVILGLTAYIINANTRDANSSANLRAIKSTLGLSEYASQEDTLAEIQELLS